MPVALVTGTSRGLGLEFVRQYAADGWRVHATCRDPDSAPGLAEIPGEVTIHRLDVDDADEVTALADSLAGEALDLLLNNAGVYGPKSLAFGGIDYDIWLDVLRTNTLAPLRMAECFVEHVARGERRRIVSVSSKVGSIAENTSGAGYIYRSSKAALNMAMASLAIDLAPRGIACCVLHPGWVRTDMGGPGGLIDPPESVAGMRRVIDGLDAASSGGFFNYDGEPIPW